MAKRSIWIGWDSREQRAYSVARRSLLDSMSVRHLIHVNPVNLDSLIGTRAYNRSYSRVDGVMYDDISQAPMSTEFAISRFWVPHLAGSGWALFTDCDVMFRRDVVELFDLADDRFAVMVVKHQRAHAPGQKMDGQIQSSYPRKNWSSVMLWNCDHPANNALDHRYLNSATGLDLHKLRWLPDHLIGELPAEWNHLVGIDPPREDAAIVHFTLGTPDLPGYENCEYSDEWWKALG